VRVHQADLVGLRDHVRGVGLVLVVLGGLRPDLAGSEVVRELAQGPLLFRQRKGDAGADCLCRSHFRPLD